jgi:hypothetical protein
MEVPSEFGLIQSHHRKENSELRTSLGKTEVKLNKTKQALAATNARIEEPAPQVRAFNPRHPAPQCARSVRVRPARGLAPRLVQARAPSHYLAFFSASAERRAPSSAARPPRRRARHDFGWGTAPMELARPDPHGGPGGDEARCLRYRFLSKGG